jgi:DNA-binding NarL/FixJ family response regulator
VRIFIADVSTIFRKALMNSISQCDNAKVVGEAETAIDAIDGISRLQPDVVILDIGLKSGTGIEVLHSIRRNGTGSPTAIVLTNFPYDQYRRISMSLGADYYFHKATQYKEFVSVLRDLSRARIEETESVSGTPVPGL